MIFIVKSNNVFSEVFNIFFSLNKDYRTKKDFYLCDVSAVNKNCCL